MLPKPPRTFIEGPAGTLECVVEEPAAGATSSTMPRRSRWMETWLAATWASETTRSFSSPRPIVSTGRDQWKSPRAELTNSIRMEGPAR